MFLALGLGLALLGLAPAGAQPTTAPVPPEIAAALSTDRARLERFLAGGDFNYFQLEMKLREVLPQVDTLERQGQAQAALDALAGLAAIKPLDDIPHMGLLMRRVQLLMQLGRAAEAASLQLRYMLMDLVVAGDRDARSEATAIEVPFIEYEYVWLAKRGFKREKQSLRQQGERSYDVLEVVDREGQRGTFYFDVTRLQKLRMDGIGQAKP